MLVSPAEQFEHDRRCDGDPWGITAIVAMETYLGLHPDLLELSDYTPRTRIIRPGNTDGG